MAPTSSQVGGLGSRRASYRAGEQAGEQVGEQAGERESWAPLGVAGVPCGSAPPPASSCPFPQHLGCDGLDVRGVECCQLEGLQVSNDTASSLSSHTGSDDMNVRVWKANASEQLGTLLPRERKKHQYNAALVERHKHLPGEEQVAADEEQLAAAAAVLGSGYRPLGGTAHAPCCSQVCKLFMRWALQPNAVLQLRLPASWALLCQQAG